MREVRTVITRIQDPPAQKTPPFSDTKLEYTLLKNLRKSYPPTRHPYFCSHFGAKSASYTRAITVSISTAAGRALSTAWCAVWTPQWRWISNSTQLGLVNTEPNQLSNQSIPGDVSVRFNTRPVIPRQSIQHKTYRKHRQRSLSKCFSIKISSVVQRQYRSVFVGVGNLWKGIWGSELKKERTDKRKRVSEWERERERQTDRQTDRQKERKEGRKKEWKKERTNWSTDWIRFSNNKINTKMYFYCFALAKPG